MLEYIHSSQIVKKTLPQRFFVTLFTLVIMLLVGTALAGCESPSETTDSLPPTPTPLQSGDTVFPVTLMPTSSPVPPTVTPSPTPIFASSTPTPQFQPTCFNLSQSSGQADLYGTKVVFIRTDHAVGAFDLLEGQESVIASVSSAKRGYDFASPIEPVIYGDWVAWSEQYGPQEARIYAFNLETEEERAISSPDTHPDAPSIYGDKLAWASWHQGSSQLLLHDLQTGVSQVVETETAVGSVHIWGDWLVYNAGRDGSGADIVVQNLLTGEEKWVITDPDNQYVLCIQGDTILYEDYAGYTAGGCGKICAYDLPTGNVKCLLDMKNPIYRVDVWGSLITWSEQIDGIWQIYLHDLQTGSTKQVTYTPDGAGSPCINDQYLVWFQESQLDYAHVPQVCYLPLDDVQAWLD